MLLKTGLQDELIAELTATEAGKCSVDVSSVKQEGVNLLSALWDLPYRDTAD